MRARLKVITSFLLLIEAETWNYILWILMAGMSNRLLMVWAMMEEHSFLRMVKSWFSDHQGQNPPLAAKGTLLVLSAGLFAPPEHRRDHVAAFERRMAEAPGLLRR